MTDIIVKGPVLGPGWIGRPELGLTDRPLTEKEIQKAAYSFLPGTPIGHPLIDKQHDFTKQAEVIESFVTSQDYQFNNQVYPPGTWFITSRITDEGIGQEVLDGTYTGYSVSAWPESQRGLLEQKLADGGMIAKGLFDNTGEGEWFPLAVSIAKLPFYPEAVFKVFEPDEIIKKEIPTLEVDKLSEEGNVLGNAFNKLLDIVINKEVNVEDVTTQLVDSPKFVTEEMLDSKLDAHYDKIEGLMKESNTEDETSEESEEESEESETEEAAAESGETEESSEESEESESESEESTDNTMISKAIQIDDVKQEQKGKKGFLEECGCDALGRNPKYL